MENISAQITDGRFIFAGFSPNPETQKEGIRTHNRITAFFLKFFGKIVELKTDTKIIYLNKNSLKKWLEQNRVIPEDSSLNLQDQLINNVLEKKRIIAAIKIQKNTRDFLARNHLKKKTAAIKIQKVTRGFLARKLQREKRIAAVKIQKVARGFLTRQQLKREQASKLAAEALAEKLAITKESQTTAPIKSMLQGFVGHFVQNLFRHPMQDTL